MINFLKQLFRIIKYGTKERFRFIPTYPRIVNFDITYQCNSHCSMCNMWRHDRTYEFSVAELQRVLEKKLFHKIEHIGLTGGEPSLREDFPSIVDILIQSLPSLKSLSIISNCVSPEKTERIITTLYDKCKESGLQFELVLSMDGVGSYHDKNRGVKGNYSSLMTVIDFVSKKSIPFSLGYTITKNNILSIYDSFELAQRNNWNLYFAVGEFIDRLNNQDCRAIKSFSDEERYELLLFFHKLMNNPTIPAYYRRSYWKNFELLSGRTRPIGCPYQKEGIVLSPALEVGHCAVKGRIVGSAKDKDISAQFFKTWFREKRLVKHNCDKCFHYHYQKSSREEIENLKVKLRRRFYSVNNLKYLLDYSSILSRPLLQRFILIVGWYGTETVGDKAILATIIKDYASQGYKIVVASIYPFVTQRTIKELDLDAIIICSESVDLIRYSKYAEKVIMGGGPLMDLDDLKYPLVSFSISHKYNHENVVYGCGIGPLNSEKSIVVVRKILALSDSVFLRDGDSLKLFREWFPTKEAQQVEDPAIQYILDCDRRIQVEQKDGVLACFLRRLPHEYSHEEDAVFENRLASYIRTLAKQEGIKRVVLYSMHNFWIGNDDREFARYFKSQYFHDTEDDISVEVDNTLSTVDNTIERMKSAKLVLCMRFHSLLFAHSLGVDYKVIDYTNGGKTKAFLYDHDSMDHLEDLFS